MLRSTVQEAIRAEALYASIGDLIARPVCDPEAEMSILSALINGVITKPFCGLESAHFLGKAHQELYARAHLPWAQIRGGVAGDSATVDAFFALLKADCGPFAIDELSELAYRIKELAAQRRLIELMRRLEVELRFGQIQVCDAEHVLQEHLLRDVAS